MSNGMDFPSTVWDVVMVASVTDGDTVRIVRQQVLNFDARQYYLSDFNPKGVPHRLVWVDTPERGEPGWSEARLDLVHWLTTRTGPLKAIVYGSAGWDRLLVDLVDPNGESASQWMMINRGWPPFEGDL